MNETIRKIAAIGMASAIPALGLAFVCYVLLPLAEMLAIGFLVYAVVVFVVGAFILLIDLIQW